MNRKKNIQKEKQGHNPLHSKEKKMTKYIIKTIKDGQEEIVYTKHYDELEREYFDLYLEEEDIDEEEYEEDGDIDELWDLFYESELYKECLEIVNGEVV